MPPRFTAPDTWSGGFYEMSFDLAPPAVTAAHALAALWHLPQLSGCYLARDVEPDDQPRHDPRALPPEGHVYGVATLPDGQRCACGSYTADFDSDGVWVSLYIPLGALAAAYPLGGYPFGVASPHLESTLRMLNEWFRLLAVQLYGDVHYSVAVIGFESHFTDVRAQVRAGIPAERWDGFVLPGDSGLHWYPPTHYGSQFA